MSFRSSKFLVFGLGVAAFAALSYKFTRYLFGEQRQITDAVSPRREDSGCCLEESRVSTSFELLNDEGDYPQRHSKTPVLVSFPGNTPVGFTVKTRRNDVTDVGIQYPSVSFVSTEVQCNRESEEENQMIVMNLKLAHTNIFMLKKQFDEDLSKQIAGDLKVAFRRSQRMGNYIFLQGSTADMAVSTTFCAERYDGEEVTRCSIPDELYFDNSISCMTVIGKGST